MSAARRFLPALLAVGLLGIAGSARAQETVYSAAQRQDPLGNEWESARVAAMGSAFVGLADDAEALLWNPAGLSDLPSAELSLHHAGWLGQLTEDDLLLGLPVKGLGGLGFSGQYVGYGSFDGRDFTGAPTNDYTANQLGLGIGWGRNLFDRLSAGVALHGVQQTFAEKSYTLVGCDLGVMLRVSPGWRIGAAYVNQGLGASSRELASSFRMGLSKRWTDWKGLSLLGALSGEIKPQIGKSVQAGLEAGYQSIAFFRAGFSHPFQKTDYDGFSGLTLGVGFALKGFQVDYAFIPYGDLGDTHRVSVAYKWGGAKPTPTAVPPSPVPTPAASPVAAAPLTATGSSSVSSPAANATPQAVPAGPVSGTEKTITMEFDLPDTSPIARAKALAQKGWWSESVQAFRDILLKNPSDSLAWRELGNVYYLLKKRDYAIQCFQNYLKLRPDDKELAAWLAVYQAAAPAAPTPSPP